MKRVVSIALCVMLAMSMLIPVSAATAKAPAKQKPVTLTAVMNTDYYKSGIIEVMKKLTKDTGITLKIEKIPSGEQCNLIVATKFATGNVPDVLFYYSDGAQFKPLGLENFVEQSGQPWMKNYDMNAWKAGMSLNGAFYAAPYWGQNVSGMLYNKKVFKNLGLKVPQSYTELVAACKKIRAAKIDPIFLSGKDGWTNMIYSWCTATQGLDFAVVNKINTNKSKYVDLKNLVGGLSQQLELMKKGYCNKNVLSATYDQAQKALATGTAAMYCMGTWVMTDIATKYPKEANDIGFFPVPYIGGGKDVVGSFTPNAIYVVRGPKQADAQRFVNYFESVPVQNTYFSVEGGIPTIKGVTKTKLTPAELEAKSYVDKGRASLVFSIGFKYGWGDYGALCQDVLAGTKTPLQAIQAADAEFQKNAKAAVPTDPNFK
jgi:raffinose/stachyose/melibiose transport system substrate-binding protein